MTETIQAIRHVIPAFKVNHFFTQPKKLQTNSELQTPETDWSLWLLTADRHQPPIIIFDDKGAVRESKLEYCLEPLRNHTNSELREQTLKNIFARLPQPLMKKLEEIFLKWPETQEIIFEVVPRLRSPEILRSMNWLDFMDNRVISFKHGEEEQKDLRLVLVHKTGSLKGLDPYCNPHAIECTQGGTGKSEFYFNLGQNFGKVTRNAFLGFAKSPTEIYPGMIDGAELPVGVDQIESQSAPQIMAFMFNFLERGEDNVASGGVVFRVKGRCTVHFLANPSTTGDKIDATKSFRNLLYHLSYNAAIGRRIGIICYGTDFKKIRHKPSQTELIQWKNDIQLFRAVEEYCEPRLRKLISNADIRDWLNQAIPGYEIQIEVHANRIEENSVRSFLIEHASGAQVRVRGAALYASFVDLLDKIALDEVTVDTILDHADDLLSEVVRLNIESVAKIAENWRKESADYAKLLFQNSPSYLKEILSAIELWRRTYPESTEILLNQIPYDALDPTYSHLSKAANKLTKRTGKGKATTLSEIREYFAVQLIEKPGEGILVQFVDSSPCAAIEPVGKLSPISPFLGPETSPIHQLHRFTTVSEKPPKTDKCASNMDDKGSESAHRQAGETVKTVKLVNQPDISPLGTEEGREAATGFLTQWCKHLDIGLMPEELVSAGYTKDLAQAERFVKELSDRGLLGGSN